MQIFKIPKKNGSFRKIYAPDPEEKEHLRYLLDTVITPAAERKMTLSGNIQHGFRPGRSAVTNAVPHINWSFTLCFDLSDFFDSVRPEHVPEFAAIPELWPDGAARQGLPTSPALANMAACGMDMEILALADRRRFCPHFVYTRYADDLSFSFGHNVTTVQDHKQWENLLRERVPTIARKYGFEINPSKTRLQCAKAGVRYITGVGIEDGKLRPSREVKRRLRAAKYNGNDWEAGGLEEWCKLKLPKRAASVISEPATGVAVVSTEIEAEMVRFPTFSRKLNFGV